MIISYLMQTTDSIYSKFEIQIFVKQLVERNKSLVLRMDANKLSIQ